MTGHDRTPDLPAPIGPGTDDATWMERLREILAGVPGMGQMAMAMSVGAGGDAAVRGLGLTGTGVRSLPKSRSGDQYIPIPEDAELDGAITHSADWLFKEQKDDGHWCAELEADTTLESYFILFYAFFGKADHPNVQKYKQIILEEMLPEGGWPIFYGGPAEISLSVLSYFALKIAGVPESDPRMRKTREVILGLGGVTAANTYTKYHLALFDQYDWDHVPAIPPEMIFLPNVAPINIYDMSSWSRTIFVPLSIIWALKPVHLLPKESHVDEIFVGGREHAELALKRDRGILTWKNFFLLTDRALKIAEKFPIQLARKAAMRKAEAWMIERFEASGGLGAILPAMMNSVYALRILGYSEDDEIIRKGLKELEGLEVPNSDGTIHIQPCLSPVWDTAISTYALGVAGLDRDPRLHKAAEWLLSKEVKQKGDWHVKNPTDPAGWYFEYENEFYPDVDDTIMVMMSLRAVYPRGESEAADAAIARGLRWVLGMQNKDGGWGAFDRDNDMDFLTKVPFADHNAMIDPSTSDITSRVLEMLASIAPETFTLQHPVVRRALAFIKKDQCRDGSWIGRWGVNYMYGTWQVLRGLRLIGEDMSKGYARKGVEWLLSVQLEDGGWGERADTYDDPSKKGLGPSTASQTAWAVMGLLAAGQGDSQSVRRGIRYLMETMTLDGTWDEDEWTGTGFPKVFYLKYHYYRHYWPLMAMGQYRRYLRGYRP